MDEEGQQVGQATEDARRLPCRAAAPPDPGTQRSRRELGSQLRADPGASRFPK